MQSTPRPPGGVKAGRGEATAGPPSAALRSVRAWPEPAGSREVSGYRSQPALLPATSSFLLFESRAQAIVKLPSAAYTQLGKLRMTASSTCEVAPQNISGKQGVLIFRHVQCQDFRI